MSTDRGLPSTQMARLAAEVRGATSRLSREQMLDLADLLHDEIRARGEQRSWRSPSRSVGRG
ncbi:MULTISPECIES: hypothetical protein [unclassified Phenylobacterium]|uniref:hypothetical protein n=1 Tax=unclassified Phenylobacterium TaxID=2640670 RepID=UPI000A4F7A54|nr:MULTISPECIES: hypothetical protein [unclassified Phenylobacterium]